jgi:hypothetical protein
LCVPENVKEIVSIATRGCSSSWLLLQGGGILWTSSSLQTNAPLLHFVSTSSGSENTAQALKVVIPDFPKDISGMERLEPCSPPTGFALQFLPPSGPSGQFCFVGQLCFAGQLIASVSTWA